MNVATFVMTLVGDSTFDDALDSRGGRRLFVNYVGVPAFVVTVWLFERLIFGRRRRHPLMRRRRGAALSDRAWRERADAEMRKAEEKRSEGPMDNF